MNKLKQILSWFDINVLFLLSTFLIIFIPLFPKIPLFDVLPGYIVRARPEDVLILLTALVWIRDALKKRFTVPTTYFWMVIAYAVTGAISILLGTILLQSIPAQLLHIGKSSLHLFRYLEYFALFFFTYSSVRTQKQLKVVLTCIAFTVIGVVFYGIGQEYLHFPLYSTMNREYSKGVTLYLQEGARPQSTFAGHYDLAAYLVIVLPIIFSLALYTLKINFKNIKASFREKTNYVSAFLHITHILGAWMLVTSGSKTALLAYIVGIFVVLAFYLKKLGNFKQQLKWGGVAVITLLVGLTLFLNIFAQSTKNQLISLVKNTLSDSQLPNNPDAKPEDLVGDGIVFKQVTKQDELGNEYTEWIEEQSTWSANALKYGLSMGIRLDTLWPHALRGFANNPLFGNGYATLAVLDTPGAYSNEDSTDNNFLRTIGETGILGFITFYGLILIIVIEILKSKTESSQLQAVRAGYLGAVLGLLINATYIDVFAASKVAYTFWAISGVVLAVFAINPLETIKKIYTHFSKHWPLYLAIFIAFFLLHKNPFHKYAQIKDLNVSDTQIESLISAKCFINTGSFVVCGNNGTTLKENLNLYSILLVPFFKISDNPAMFYVLNLSLVLIVLISLYTLTPKIISKITKQKVNQFYLAVSLLIYLLILTMSQFTNRPLSTTELVLFLLILPILNIVFVLILHKLQNKIGYLVELAVFAIVFIFLVSSGYITTFKLQFRNNIVSDKQMTLDLTNVHFDTHRYLNREKDFYVLTTLSPYYINLFSNNNWHSLPLSEEQPYVAQAEKTYSLISSSEPLLSQYKNIVNEKKLYVSDYGINKNENYKKAFSELKNTFDLTYVAIGCDDSCNLFTIETESEKVSPDPESINSKKISILSLKNEYSFAVVSNRFEPKIVESSKQEPDLENTKPYRAIDFAKLLNSKLSYSDSFLVLTGDVSPDYSEKSKNAFTTNFSRLPILYNAGNHDINPDKLHPSKNNYFFTDSEFYIFLNLSENSEIDSDQKRFVYNALLTLEKLPNIKNIFIISHNLDWQNRENPNNFIFDLERKLSEFPELNKFVISSFHSTETELEKLQTELSIKHITDETTKTQYFASFIRDWENDSFFEFVVHKDNTVTVEYRVKGDNF